MSRLVEALEALGWDQFLTNATGTALPKFDRIIMGGHSAGTGHAAYAAWLYEWYRAAFISGPQNCCGKLFVDR
eukprot:86217-Prorocentrum_minimum.AAC.1